MKRSCIGTKEYVFCSIVYLWANDLPPLTHRTLHYCQFMPIRRGAWTAWNYLTSSVKPSGSPTTAASDVNTVAL